MATLAASPPRHTSAVTALINPEEDDLRPVGEVIKSRLGRKVSPATQWRWIRKGIGGSRLEVVRSGGLWMTTTAAFAAFLRAQTETALSKGTTSARTPEKLAKLKAAGLVGN